MMQKPKRSL